MKQTLALLALLLIVSCADPQETYLRCMQEHQLLKNLDRLEALRPLEHYELDMRRDTLAHYARDCQ